MAVLTGTFLALLVGFLSIFFMVLLLFGLREMAVLDDLRGREAQRSGDSYTWTRYQREPGLPAFAAVLTGMFLVVVGFLSIFFMILLLRSSQGPQQRCLRSMSEVAVLTLTHCKLVHIELRAGGGNALYVLFVRSCAQLRRTP